MKTITTIKNILSWVIPSVVLVAFYAVVGGWTGLDPGGRAVAAMFFGLVLIFSWLVLQVIKFVKDKFG